MVKLYDLSIYLINLSAEMTNTEKQTEKKIFDAATEIFEEKGMAAARMQDIADRAGINKALLHYYFRTKEKLFKAVFDVLAEKMFEKFAGILEKEMTFNDKIRFFCSEHMTFLQKNPKLPLFILNEINRNPGLLDKFLKKINIKNIHSQISGDDSVRISENEIMHLLVSIVSLSAFPIAAKPILTGILEQSGLEYDSFIEQRKSVVPDFIINAVNPYSTVPKNKPES